LKDKIKEDEDEEMAEDTQVLEEIPEKELETLEIDAELSKSKEPMKELDKELGKSLAALQKEPEPQAKPAPKSAKASKIDQMLEDTLSEFGLNVDKKAKPKEEHKIEFQAKMDALVEELKNGKAAEESETLEPKAKKKAVKEPEIKPDVKAEIKPEAKPEPKPDPEPEISKEDLKDLKEEISETPEVKVKEPEAKESEEVAPEVEAPTIEPVEVPDVVEEVKEETVEEPKEEKTIFAAEVDEKEKVPLLQTLKNSIPFLKKLPMKFIIPGALIAAIAVSASFVFRKPGKQTPTPKQTAAVMQKAKSQEMSKPEEIVVQSPSKEESKPASEVNEEPETIAEDPQPKQEAAQEATVKTRVSQVFQVEEPKAKPRPDLNPIDVSEDVISTDPSEELAAPILSETESAPIPEDDFRSGSQLGTAPATLDSSQDESSSSTLEESSDPPEPEKPKTKLGDLVPMSEVDIPPEIAKRVEPKYPSYALSRGVGGKVIFNVLISEKGEVIETALLRGIKGPYGFNEECEKAIRQWKFVPAFKDGIKVKVWKTVSFTFKKT
jgi:TonB family protein